MAVKCPKCQTDNPSDSKYCKECATPLPSLKDIDVTATLEAPKEELTTGSTFAGRYQIIEELGKGGMGKVYKVQDTKIKEKIALKLIKPEIAKDKKTIERFSNELRLARKIRHKNICQMFDLGEAKETHFITMEFVPGQDLKGLIRQTGQLAVGTTINIAKQICDGLTEAHKSGVIHRDLKPSNIMIDKEGNVRIMDFGIARSLKAKGITGAGVMIGTPEYMSPEQVEGKEVDQRSDIYSLGIILYEMVTGRVPFEGDTPFTVGVKQKSEVPQNPKELNPQISDDLNNMILRCLEKDKENRFQKAGELRSELENIERGIPTTEKVIPKRKSTTSKEITVTFGLKKLFIPALVVIAIVIIGVIIWQLLPKKEAVPSIAVLPFEDLSPQKDQGHICDGLAATIINALTKVKDLHVPATTSSFSFRGKEQDMQEIGEKLNVKTVLRGSVQKAGNRVRIIAQIINVADKSFLWSEHYNREIDDVFAIQDEITLAIVNKLKLKLLSGEREKLLKRYTENTEAYNFYLRGRYFWDKRSVESMKKGIEYFQKAIESDPAYALAYTGLADSYMYFSFYGYLSPKDAFQKAKAAARKALEIDDTLAEAHASLGYISMIYDWEWSASEHSIRRAIELNPGYATAHHWYAAYLAIVGHFEESISEIKRALELDPLSLRLHCELGNYLRWSGRVDEALEQLEKTLEMNPDFHLVHMHLGLTYQLKGMYNKSISSFQKSLKLVGDSPLVLGSLGYTYVLSGQRDKAKKLLQKLEEQSKERYVPFLYIANIYAELGEMDKAFEWIDKAHEEHDTLMSFLKTWPEFERIRSDPRGKALLKKIGLEK